MSFQRGKKCTITTTRKSNMYHYITIQVVMRDCKSKEDAIEKCSQLMLYNPDENTIHMESWEITKAISPFEVSPVVPTT